MAMSRNSRVVSYSPKDNKRATSSKNLAVPLKDGLTGRIFPTAEYTQLLNSKLAEAKRLASPRIASPEVVNPGVAQCALR